MKIDFYSSWEHYARQLLPIYEALPLELRSEWMVGDVTKRDCDVIVVGAYRDFRFFTAGKKVLVEHGAGQSYSTKHAAYAGGERRPFDLHLVPRLEVGDWGVSQVGVIGALHMIEPVERELCARPLIVQSFHWECAISPESGTSFWDYIKHMSGIHHRLTKHGCDYALHAHPRIQNEVRQFAIDFDIPFIADFDTVMRRASVYAVDNSSTLFEFASLDKPVVVVNAKEYRRDKHHGLRFWECADIGEQVDDPTNFVHVAFNAVKKPTENSECRTNVAKHVYTHLDNQAAARAKDFLLQL